MGKHDEAGATGALSTELEEARWEQVLAAWVADAYRRVAGLRGRAPAGQTADLAEFEARSREAVAELATAQRRLEEWRAD